MLSAGIASISAVGAPSSTPCSSVQAPTALLLHFKKNKKKKFLTGLSFNICHSVLTYKHCQPKPTQDKK